MLGNCLLWKCKCNSNSVNWSQHLNPRLVSCGHYTRHYVCSLSGHDDSPFMKSDIKIQMWRVLILCAPAPAPAPLPWLTGSHSSHSLQSSHNSHSSHCSLGSHGSSSSHSSNSSHSSHSYWSSHWSIFWDWRTSLWWHFIYLGHISERSRDPGTIWSYPL